MALHAATIFLGAFLLFQLQPLMGKFLLPWFGGGPGVWTACLLFFQALLLGGYAYAHWLSTLRPGRQASVHVVLLIASLAFLPIRPAEAWQPEGTGDPLLRILLTLAATVGLPYFALSATGPLLQCWASLGRPGAAPYRLYALSNAGSLLALLTFPFVFEPLASRQALSAGWSAGLVVFVVLCTACARRLHRMPAAASAAGAAGPGSDAPGSAAPATAKPVTGSDRFFWVALPAAASLLLVATTNKVCLDIAAFPFLWVLPLAVYLLSFILCFDHPRWYSRRWHGALLAAGSFATALCLVDTAIPLPVQVAVYVLTLFGGCMVAHGELHRLRPAAGRLTGFYLAIATGGAAGSAFVALLAPLLFSDYYEVQLGVLLLLHLMGAVSLLYRSRSLAVGAALGLLAAPFLVPLLRAHAGLEPDTWFRSWMREQGYFLSEHAAAIGAGLLIMVVALRHGWRAGPVAWQRRVSLVPLLLAMVIGVVFLAQARRTGGTLLTAARNFYGAYKLRVYNDDNPATRFLLLSHGGTTHGLQLSQPETAGWPTTYFGVSSGAGRILDGATARRRIGLVGLGAGTLAVYGRPGDYMRFYEIDPAIIAVAQGRFTFLRNAQARVEIVQGDARLAMEDELRRGQRRRFDVLVLDAFSGDAIPVHLLTREAMAVYLQHLRPGGLLAIHISNRHLDLRPVVAGLARQHGLHFATINDVVPVTDWWLSNSSWVLLCADPRRLEPDAIKSMTRDPTDATVTPVDWTDDHASLFSVLK